MKLALYYEKQSGVTLIELLIVVAIAAVLAVLAGPSFSNFVNRSRQGTVVTELYSDLNRARSEAIKRNARVLLCVRASDTACGAGTDWSAGWLVCADADADNACDAGTATAPNPIYLHQPLHSTLTLTGPNAPVRYNPSGIAGSGAAVFSVGGAWSGAATRSVSVAASGNLSKS